MKNLFFIALTIITFSNLQSQPKCDQMLNDFKNSIMSERPQDFDSAMEMSQTFSTNWLLAGCDRSSEEFISISNELRNFVESMRGGNAANDFNFSFDKSTVTKETDSSNTDEITEDSEAQKTGFGNKLMEKYAEGGVGFMTCVLICLILGLALCIERIIYLHLASSNSKNLLEKIEAALKSGGVEAAKDECRNTTGPTASICLQGLERSDEDLELIEKSIMSYGSVQMGLLEKGTSWISSLLRLHLCLVSWEL